VCPLLAIEDPEFAHWYGLGVWWAMYGDQQGTGPYSDDYLFDNIQRGIANGWYHDLHSGWFPMIGFNLGMVHGGQLIRPSDTLVVLSDPDFTQGYYAGRNYYFTEAPLDGRQLTDTLFIEAVNNWALDYSTWHEPEATLLYCLGCRIGELHSVLLPSGQTVAYR
jgi:hypothetical protein